MAEFPGSLSAESLTSDGIRFGAANAWCTGAFVGSGSNAYVNLSATTPVTYNGKTYVFSRWSFSGTVPSWNGAVTSSSITSLTRGQHETTGSTLKCTANYVIDDGGGGGTTTYAVITSASPSAGGTTVVRGYGSSRATVAAGTTVVVDATANTGYRFLYWIGTGKVYNTAMSATINANRYFVAYFAKMTGLIIRKG